MKFQAVITSAASQAPPDRVKNQGPDQVACNHSPQEDQNPEDQETGERPMPSQHGGCVPLDLGPLDFCIAEEAALGVNSETILRLRLQAMTRRVDIACQKFDMVQSPPCWLLSIAKSAVWSPGMELLMTSTLEVPAEFSILLRSQGHSLCYIWCEMLEDNCVIKSAACAASPRILSA